MEMSKMLPTHAIPGQSLVGEPGNTPWEQPPQLTSINDVVDYYSEKLTSEESIASILVLLKKDTPIMSIVRVLTKQSLMNGIHTVDAGFVVTPVIVEIIKTIAEVNDVGYVLEKGDLEKSMTVPKALVEKVVKDAKQSAEQIKEEAPKRGLMAKGE